MKIPTRGFALGAALALSMALASTLAHAQAPKTYTL
jgi:hypothetical protein